jgi:lysophospholipase L1-like esterase
VKTRKKRSLRSPFVTHAKKRFLALGDSYTIGESVEAYARWPVQLARLLAKKQRQTWHLHMLAKTGWTTDELDLAITAALDQIEPPYDLVSLLIGVNNQYRQREVLDYQAQFTQLLQRAIGFAGDKPEHVFVLSIPDWGCTPFARSDIRSRAEIGAQIDAYNRAARAICDTYAVLFIDITFYTRGRELGLLAFDQLHPSAKAYAKWAKLAMQQLGKQLASTHEKATLESSKR